MHERSLDADLLLALLRDALPLRPSLRLVLMSATLDADVFAAYFKLQPAAVLCIPGRTFPVKELFLEDVVAATRFSNHGGDDGGGGGGGGRGGGRGQVGAQAGAPSPAEEAAALRAAGYSAEVASTVASLSSGAINYSLLGAILAHICADPNKDPGGILVRVLCPKKGLACARCRCEHFPHLPHSSQVFLPGLAEIGRAREAALSQPAVRSATGGGASIVALHSALGSAEQQAAFAPPPHGTRKLVLGASHVGGVDVSIQPLFVCLFLY